MNKTLKSILLPPYRVLLRASRLWHKKNETKRLLGISNDKRRMKIFYFGIPEHSNLGDLAQYYCTIKWIRRNYPSVDIHEFEPTTVVDSYFNFLDKFSKIFSPNDLIFFQSGYTTQDLGGYHDLMHRLVIDRFPDARVVMLPQTVFFKSEQRKLLTSRSYNQDGNLLFLARDRVSYGMACEMFPDVTVKLYPDIVTSLIGHYQHDYERDKVLFCCRNDGEKFYSDEEISQLRQGIDSLLPTEMMDTTIKENYKKIRDEIECYVENLVDRFAHYKLIITDRYHGTIFSLISNTPVIVIKTNDHKVTTGVEWFRGVYDDYVFLADSLEHAYELAKTILEKDYTYDLKPFFDRKYYEKLKEVIDDKYGENA